MLSAHTAGRWSLVTLALLPFGSPVAQQPSITIGPNLRVIPGEHNEPWVAVSATNPDVVIAAAQQGGGVGQGRVSFAASTAISHDGGRTWVPVNLPNPSETPFDVMVAAGPNGRLYVMQGVMGGDFLQAVGVTGPRKPTIRVWSSTDEGWTWDGPTELSSPVPQDHMRMTVDMGSGPHRGRVYIAWNDVADQFVRDHYEVFLQYSDDNGRSFTDPMLIDTRTDGKLVATEPVSLSNGAVLVTYYQYFNPLARKSNEHMPMFVARSTDGAKTFSTPEKIFEFGPHVWPEKVGAFSRAFSLPVVTADTSSKSPYRDHVYITWDDVRGGSSNIWFVRSTDGGKSWSVPARVNDNATVSPLGVADYRMTPVVAVNPAGEVGIAWYDRRNDPHRMCWDYYAAFSSDGGAHFGTNQRITTAPSCPPPGMAPFLSVHNTSPRLGDPNRMPDSLLAHANIIQRIQHQTVDENQRARDEAERALTTSRLFVVFDPARNVWPGHYTGLAADRDGVFHALWLDRRSGQQELYSARIVASPPTVPTALFEGDVTDKIEVITGPPSFDSAKNTVKLAIQVRNVSQTPVHGPVSLRLRGIGSVAGFDTTIVFRDKLGNANVLAFRDLSEPIELSVVVKPDAGYDAAFDFQVRGSLPAAR